MRQRRLRLVPVKESLCSLCLPRRSPSDARRRRVVFCKKNRFSLPGPEDALPFCIVLSALSALSAVTSHLLRICILFVSIGGQLFWREGLLGFFNKFFEAR